MVTNNLEYYKITLIDEVDSLNIGDKRIGIYGVRLLDGFLHELVSGKKLVPEYDNVNILYKNAVPCEPEDIEYINECIGKLTLDERERFIYKLNIVKDINTNNYFGIGDKITKKLIYKK